MSMSPQAKDLKSLVIAHGICSKHERLHVRTGVETRGGKVTGYGAACIAVRALTDDEVQALLTDDQYLDIRNYPQFDFAFIYSDRYHENYAYRW